MIIWLGLPTNDTCMAINSLTRRNRELSLKWLPRTLLWARLPLLYLCIARARGFLRKTFWFAAAFMATVLIRRIVKKWILSKKVAAISRSSRQAKAILSLCHNKYWSRIWIVQEIVVAKDIVIFCGRHSFGWAQLESLFMRFDEDIINGHEHIANHPFEDEIYASPAIRVSTMRLGWQALPENAKGFPLASLLISLKDMGCADERDQMYGILGLIHEDEYRALGISVDYSISVVELYVNTLRSFSRCKPWNRAAFDKLAVRLMGKLKLSTLDMSVDNETQKILDQCHDVPTSISRAQRDNQLRVSSLLQRDHSPLSIQIIAEQNEHAKRVQTQWEDERETKRQQLLRVS